jgi:hypothetical protein
MVLTGALLLLAMLAAQIAAQVPAERPTRTRDRRAPIGVAPDASVASLVPFAGRRVAADPTPALPVGGNTGTTLGEQRLIAFTHAASLWSARLDSSVPIRIRAQFTPLGAGVLGSAGPVSVVRDFQNAPLPGTWYHVALANELANVDLLPVNDDFNANFSTNFNSYVGLDNHALRDSPTSSWCWCTSSRTASASASSPA